MYTSVAELIPNVTGEKTMQMYYLERRTDPEFPLLNYETHYGPEVVLVKTAEFTTTRTSATATATSRSSYNSDSNDDSPSRLSRGKIAIIASCVVVGVLGLLLWCCIRRCASKRKRSKDEVEMAQPLQTVGRERNQQVRMQPRESGQVFSLGAIHDESTGPGTAISNTAEYRDAQRNNADEVVPILPPYSQDEPPKYTP
jgi:hypothetical protein